ncbi:hypothetical protein GO300_03821 [Ralstonia solanacearum]|nr:hypothetical protein [Ralstonia solanacearum]
MSFITEQSATAARVHALSEYRDALIRARLVSKARRYLRQVEHLESVTDPALREQFEERWAHLDGRQSRLDDILAELRSNPLVAPRKPHARAPLSTGHGAVSTRASAGSAVTEVPAANHGAGIAHEFASFADDEDWSVPCTPSTNINGLPMVGCIDIHGNPYGFTNFDNNTGF